MLDRKSRLSGPAFNTWIRPLPFPARLAMVLEALIAVTAIPAGVMLAVRPDGSLIGMPLEVLDGTPFRTFLVPGLILALVVGGSAAAALSAVLLRRPFDRILALGSGLTMVGWITVQVLLLGYLSMLQPIVLLVGLALLLLSFSGRSGASEA